MSLFAVLFIILIFIIIISLIFITCQCPRILCWMLGILCGLTVMKLSTKIHYSSITIKKSSDSDWEYSKDKFPDTTITRIVITSKGDTVYPTTVYKNIYLE